MPLNDYRQTEIYLLRYSLLIRKVAAAKKEAAKARAGKHSSSPLPFCPPERSHRQFRSK